MDWIEIWFILDFILGFANLACGLVWLTEDGLKKFISVFSFSISGLMFSVAILLLLRILHLT